MQDAPFACLPPMGKETSISKSFVRELLFLWFSAADNTPGIFSRSACHTSSTKLQLLECSVNYRHEALPGRLIITDRPTRRDWAHSTRQMLEAGDADAGRMILVMDNLNTPNLVSLYLAFSPDNMGSLENYRKTRHTPEHGSWPNGAGLDLEILCDNAIPFASIAKKTAGESTGAG